MSQWVSSRSVPTTRTPVESCANDSRQPREHIGNHANRPTRRGRPSDAPLRLAIEYFHRGNYGLAQRYFRDAVEKAPKGASAWIGLAASYNHLGRFDFADQAYRQALKLVGETTALLNNRGYSYMLRGNIVAARRDFLRAYAREPGNPIILNNLKLLDGSQRFIVRSPDTLPPDAR